MKNVLMSCLKMIDNREGFFSLKSKVVIVTGAAGLLGRNHVEAIAAFGGTPVLLDISTDAVSSLQIEIKKNLILNHQLSR